MHFVNQFYTCPNECVWFGLQKNHKIFVSWAENVTEILQKIDDGKLLDNIIPRMISDMDKKYEPAK